MTAAEEELFNRVQAPVIQRMAQALHDALLEHADRAATAEALATLILAACGAVAAGAIGGLRQRGQLSWSDAKIARRAADLTALALQTWAKERRPRGKGTH